MKDLVIFGAGSVGLLAEQIIYDINQSKKEYNIIGYLDDNPDKKGSEIAGFPVLGGYDWIEKNPEIYIVIGFSHPLLKFNLHKRLINSKFNKYTTLIHPTAWIGRRVTFGLGCIVYPGVTIDVDVKIGHFNLFNKTSSIGHNTIIGDYCTISPGVNIGGFNVIGDASEFGINSCTIQNIKIGMNTTVGAGSVVIRDLESNIIAVGNPAHKIRSK